MASQYGGEVEAGYCKEADVSTDHDDIAVGEVQHFSDAVNHGIAQSNDRVDTAKTDATNQEVQKTHV